LSILSHSCWTTGFLLRKLLPTPISSSGCFALSCTSSKVPGLMLRLLIYFELVFAQDDRCAYNFSFLHADIQFSQQHLLNRLTFPHWMFLAILSHIKWESLCAFFRGLLFYYISHFASFCASIM
jgi:hypothetical protein